jgi:hypothetical protein
MGREAVDDGCIDRVDGAVSDISLSDVKSWTRKLVTQKWLAPSQGMIWGAISGPLDERLATVGLLGQGGGFGRNAQRNDGGSDYF